MEGVSDGVRVVGSHGVLRFDVEKVRRCARLLRAAHRADRAGSCVGTRVTHDQNVAVVLGVEDEACLGGLVVNVVS